MCSDIDIPPYQMTFTSLLRSTCYQHDKFKVAKIGFRNTDERQRPILIVNVNYSNIDMFLKLRFSRLFVVWGFTRNKCAHSSVKKLLQMEETRHE